MSSAAPTLKAALVEAIRGLTGISGTDVYVCYGQPGQYLPDEIIAVLDMESTHVVGPFATTRPRDEELRVDIVATVWVGGDSPETQQAATERAYELFGLVEDYVQSTPNVGSTAIRPFQGETSIQLTEDFTLAPDGITVGRVADVRGTFTFQARI